MNPEIKQRWMSALRSEKFEQGMAWLNVNGKLCCLGVLCEIAVEDGIVQKRPYYPQYPDASSGAIEYFNQANENMRSHVALPRIVADWAGLEDNDPVLSDGCFTQHASAWNDELGASFEEIANMIEVCL